MITPFSAAEFSPRWRRAGFGQENPEENPEENPFLFPLPKPKILAGGPHPLIDPVGPIAPASGSVALPGVGSKTPLPPVPVPPPLPDLPVPQLRSRQVDRSDPQSFPEEFYGERISPLEAADLSVGPAKKRGFWGRVGDALLGGVYGLSTGGGIIPGLLYGVTGQGREVARREEVARRAAEIGANRRYRLEEEQARLGREAAKRQLEQNERDMAWIDQTREWEREDRPLKREAFEANLENARLEGLSRIMGGLRPKTSQSEQGRIVQVPQGEEVVWMREDPATGQWQELPFRGRRAGAGRQLPPSTEELRKNPEWGVVRQQEYEKQLRDALPGVNWDNVGFSGKYRESILAEIDQLKPVAEYDLSTAPSEAEIPTRTARENAARRIAELRRILRELDAAHRSAVTAAERSADQIMRDRRGGNGLNPYYEEE